MEITTVGLDIAKRVFQLHGVLGATAVIRHSRGKSTAEAGWLKSLLERQPARLVSVAQANKMARIVWALLVRGEAYRMPAAVPGGAA